MIILIIYEGVIVTWDYVKYNGKMILSALLVVAVLGGICYFAYRHAQNKETQLQRATVISQEQALNIETLKSKLEISEQNAELLAKQIAAATAGTIKPVSTFTQSGASVEQAAVTVQERINNNDQTLPAAAVEKTDRTVVMPQQTTKTDGTTEYKVDVFKTNLYKNWEVSAGIGRHGDDTYVPIELQRNFDKVHSASIEYHVGGKSSGWEAKYTIRTDKLLVFF